MRNVIGLGIVVIGVVVVASACGKKSDTAAGGAADSASVAAPPPPPPAPDPVPEASTPDMGDAAAEAAALPPPSPALAAAHPAYLHALTDLRIARFNLQRRGGDRAQRWDSNIAIRAVDRAIREINMAAISDGKNVDDHPPADMNMDFGGRLHRALEALRTARADCSKAEDNAQVRGLRAAALRNIDEAIMVTEEGITDWGRPPPPGVVGRPLPPGAPGRPPPPRR
jgi:hypothetical protein